MNLQTKCIDPLFESKPDFDVMRLIAEEMGLGEYLPKTAEELVRYQIEHSEDLAEQGITLAELEKNHGSMKMADVDEPRRATLWRRSARCSSRRRAPVSPITRISRRRSGCSSSPSPRWS